MVAQTEVGSVCPACGSRGTMVPGPGVQVTCRTCRTVHLAEDLAKSDAWISRTTLTPDEVTSLLPPESGPNLTVFASFTFLWGRYRLKGRVGQGGMGTVYRAQDLDTGGDVALKRIHKAYCSNSEFIKRFLREGSILRHVRHKNLIRFVDLGVEEAGYFLVMSFAEGVNLKDLLAKTCPLPTSAAVKIIAQAAMGLHEAHKNCIVHRDIKPENLILTRGGDVKIIDFGLAKNILSATSSLTVSGQIVGTPTYMPPEQCNGQAGDNRGDVYSLGATLFYALAGRAPFSGANNWAIMFKHLNEPVPDVCAINPLAPRECADMIAMMMAKDPAARYQSMETVVVDLCRILAHRPPVLASSGDATVISTTIPETPATESAFEKALQLQDELRARGRYVPPIGELIAIAEGPVVLPRVPVSDRGLVCRCGRRLTFHLSELRCPRCGSPIDVPEVGRLSKLDRFVKVDTDITALGYGRFGFGDGLRDLVPDLVAVGEVHVVLDMSGLLDMSHDQFIWVFDVFERLAKAGGSLGVIAPSERVRTRFSAVGADKFVRLFASLGEFKETLLSADARAVYSLAERRPELWQAIDASRKSDPIRAIELYDAMAPIDDGNGGGDDREFFINYIATQLTARLARVIAEKKHAVAEKLIRRLDEAFPDYPPGLLYKGQFHLIRKDYREAAQCFSDALEANPEFLPALEGRGEANYYQDLQERAMDDFTRALDLNPNSQLACYNIACVYARKNEADTAIHWLEKAVTLGFCDAAHIASDPDLAPLSGLAAFQALLSRLTEAGPSDTRTD